QREDGARDGGETAVAPGEGNPQQHRGRPVQEERAQMQPGGHALSLLEKTHRRPPRLRKGVALQTGPGREDPPPHPGTPSNGEPGPERGVLQLDDRHRRRADAPRRRRRPPLPPIPLRDPWRWKATRGGASAQRYTPPPARSRR